MSFFPPACLSPTFFFFFPRPAVPSLFGTSDQFHGRQCFHEPEVGGWFWHVQKHYIYCAVFFFFLLLLLPFYLSSSCSRFWTLGTLQEPNQHLHTHGEEREVRGRDRNRNRHTKKQREAERLILGIGSHHYGGWAYPRPAVHKVENQESNSILAGMRKNLEHQYLRTVGKNVPAQTEKTNSCFLRLFVLFRLLDVTHQHLWGWVSFSLLIYMLISSTNSLTDMPRSNTLP